MSTIYLLRKKGYTYSEPKNLRAYESKADADDLVALMSKAGFDDLEVVELELQSDPISICLTALTMISASAMTDMEDGDDYDDSDDVPAPPAAPAEKPVDA
ncbi:MAG: hypothetical protein ABFD96_05835 [Armatimonadia bacterium]